MAFTGITENTRKSTRVGFDSKDNIYIEYNITNYIRTSGSYLMIDMIFNQNSSSFWYLYWHISSDRPTSESGLVFYYNNGNSSAEYIVNTNLALYSTGHFGASFNFSSNTVYFYYNGSVITSINSSAYTPLSNFTGAGISASYINNVTMEIPIFRNEFYYIPDGYSVIGDFLPKEAYKDKEYYYTYK